MEPSGKFPDSVDEDNSQRWVNSDDDDDDEAYYNGEDAYSEGHLELSPEDIEDQFDDILKEVGSGKVDLKDEDQACLFMSKWGSILGEQGMNGFTLIHKIAGNSLYFENHQPLLGFLLAKYPTLLEKQDEEGQTALYTAIRFKKVDVVKFLCERAADVSAALKVRTPADNCLHQALKKEPTIAIYLIEFCDREMFTDTDERGYTPLHIAVDYQLCTKDQLGIVETLLEKCDEAMDVMAQELSPYRYHLITKSNPEKQVGQAKVPSVNGSAKRNISGSAVSKYGGSTIKPKAKQRRSEVRRDLTTAQRDDISNKIQSLLKLHCMRNRGREATIEILYGLYPTREFEFDLHGPNLYYTKGCLDGMNFLKFEDILQYVALPRLTVGDEKESEEPAQSHPKLIWMGSRPDGEGRQDLLVIFRWLRDRQVKKIIKVIVEDNMIDRRAIAHSDEAIEKALSPFDVEVWDWRKMDIPIDTIKRAAPNVRELNLYSSGNNAVLRGWSDTGGLKILEKLNKVNLYVKQGLETRSRTRTNIDEFKARLSEMCSDIKVVDSIIQDRKDTRKVLDAETENKEEAKKNRWLNCMDQFVQQIVLNYVSDKKGQTEPIRVALIDDGIDGADRVLHKNIACGVSFCHRSESGNLSNTFYVASGGHGTLMATLIRRLCPPVQLYVAKLEDHTSPSGEKQITAESAAKAINWAIEREVDIISMSWTVEKTGKNKAGIDALERAIDLAAQRDILLFCSANDQGNQRDKCYPASSNNKKIFRIGAATATGDKWKWVGDGQADFIFPGEKVLVERHHGPLLQKCKVLSGSSIATALAAGLAALILYLIAADNHQNLQQMRNHGRMKAALMAPGGMPESTPYIHVWELFGVKSDHSEDDDRAVFEKVVKRLLLDPL